MPGIAGIIGMGSPEKHRVEIDTMVRCMVHERFYTSGTFTDEKLGVWAGWTAHEGSFSDCLPIWNESRDICVLFAGECFQDPEELRALQARGHEFSTENAGWLPHLYEEEGIGFLQKLNGWFSGLLVDLRRSEVMLFNDRYGIKRIYYTQHDGSLYFASEAKALLRVLPQTRQFDWTSLGEFLSCGCVLQDRSLFTGISLVPPASLWRWSSPGVVRKESYFSKDRWEALPVLTEAEFEEKLSETFSRILPRYLRGAEKIGMSLTGGVDSRMIMAWARLPEGRMPCYTFGSRYRDSRDVRVGARIARLAGQPHYVIRLDRDFISEFPTLAERTVYLSDGVMEVNGAADLYVNRVARTISPIRMTGNYGGEILRGIVAFKPVALDSELFDGSIGKRIEAAFKTYGTELSGNRLSFIAFKQMPWHHYSRLCLEESQLTIRTPYVDNELVALSYQTPAALRFSNGPSLRVIADGNRSLAEVGTDRGVFSRPIPLVGSLPRLFQEFTFKAEYAYDYGMPDFVAKVDRACRLLKLERLFLGRHKFYHFRLWYRDELGDYLRDILLDRRTLERPYLNPDRLKRIVSTHLKGTENHTLEIHRTLTSELAQRQLIELK